MADESSVSEEHSQILATKWWSAEETMAHGRFFWFGLHTYVSYMSQAYSVARVLSRKTKNFKLTVLLSGTK